MVRNSDHREVWDGWSWRVQILEEIQDGYFDSSSDLMIWFRTLLKRLWKLWTRIHWIGKKKKKKKKYLKRWKDIGVGKVLLGEEDGGSALVSHDAALLLVAQIARQFALYIQKSKSYLHFFSIKHEHGCLF